MRKDRPTWLRPDRLIVAAGILLGVGLGLVAEPAEFSGLDKALEGYLLAPLIAAVNAGISCF